MDALATYSNSTGTTKSFWSRAEGKVGMLFLAGLGGIGLFGISKILPWIITLLSNAITATALAASLFAIYLVLSNKKVHMLVSWMFKSVMWHATDMFVDLDPVAIMRGYVEVLRKHIRNIDEQLGKLRGHIDRLRRQISTNEKGINESLTTAKAAQKRNDRGVLQVEGRQAARLTDENKDLGGLLTKLENTYNVMNRIREHASVKERDIEFEVDSAIRRRDAFKTVGSALASAKAIFKGGEGKELYDSALEKMQERYSQEVGNLEDFLISTKDMMSAMEIQGDVASENILSMIDNLDQKSTLMLDGPKVQTPVMDADFSVKEPVAARSSFSDVANKFLSN
jgi:hypothetical protein